MEYLPVPVAWDTNSPKKQTFLCVGEDIKEGQTESVTRYRRLQESAAVPSLHPMSGVEAVASTPSAPYPDSCLSTAACFFLFRIFFFTDLPIHQYHPTLPNPTKTPQATSNLITITESPIGNLQFLPNLFPKTPIGMENPLHRLIKPSKKSTASFATTTTSMIPSEIKKPSHLAASSSTTPRSSPAAAPPTREVPMLLEISIPSRNRTTTPKSIGKHQRTQQNAPQPKDEGNAIHRG